MGRLVFGVAVVAGCVLGIVSAEEVPSTSVSCNFEKPNKCDYESPDDKCTAWIHTDGNEVQNQLPPSNGSFLYYRGNTVKSLLVTPSFIWNRYTGCLTFRANITDIQTGTLNVYMARAGLLSGRKLIYSSRNSSLSVDSVVKVDVDTKYPVQFIFEGVREPGFDGNITVNYVKVLPEKCFYPLDCNFNMDNTCGFTKQSGDMYFIFHGKTPSVNTGPTQDHTDGKGKFMFGEASLGTELVAKSAVVDVNVEKTCLSFWYLMHGKDIVGLNVFKASPDDPDIDREDLWSRKGEQDEDWHNIKLDVNASKPFRLYIHFEADGKEGDSAVDDIKLTVDRSCQDLEVNVTSAVDCDFEIDLCGYTHLTDDKWLLTTNSSEEGIIQLGSLDNYPCHSSVMSTTPVLSGHSRKICLRFWWITQVTTTYNSTLTVNVLDAATGAIVAQLNTSEYQGQGWQLEEFDLDQTIPLKFVFEVSKSSVEDPLLADLGLDDVEISTGTCHKEYLGCYDPNEIQNRMRPWSISGDPAHAVEYCNDLCRTAEFFSLMPKECICQYGPSFGDDDNFGGDPLSDDSRCNSPCPGNVNQTCGGVGVMSVYRTGYSDQSCGYEYFERQKVQIRGRPCVKDLGNYTYETSGLRGCHIRLDITLSSSREVFIPYLVVVKFHNVKEIKFHTRDITGIRKLNVKKIQVDKDHGKASILFDSAQQPVYKLMLQAVPDDYEQKRRLTISKLIACDPTQPEHG